MSWCALKWWHIGNNFNWICTDCEPDIQSQPDETEEPRPGQVPARHNGWTKGEWGQ